MYPESFDEYGKPEKIWGVTLEPSFHTTSLLAMAGRPASMSYGVLP